jgi:hypothetical protein
MLFLPVQMLRKLDTLIQYHGDHAQDDDGGYHHVELKETNGVDDKGYMRGIRERYDRFGIWLCQFLTAYVKMVEMT